MNVYICPHCGTHIEYIPGMEGLPCVGCNHPIHQEAKPQTNHEVSGRVRFLIVWNIIKALRYFVG